MRLALLAFTTTCGAQDFPVRPVKIIVPCAGIHADVVKVMNEPEFREKETLAKGYEPSGIGPEEYAALMAKESRQRAVMVKLSGTKVE